MKEPPFLALRHTHSAKIQRFTEELDLVGHPYTGLASAQRAAPRGLPSPVGRAVCHPRESKHSPPSLESSSCPLIGTCDSPPEAPFRLSQTSTFGCAQYTPNAFLLIRSFFCRFGSEREVDRTRNLGCLLEHPYSCWRGLVGSPQHGPVMLETSLKSAGHRWGVLHLLHLKVSKHS